MAKKKGLKGVNGVWGTEGKKENGKAKERIKGKQQTAFDSFAKGFKADMKDKGLKIKLMGRFELEDHILSYIEQDRQARAYGGEPPSPGSIGLTLGTPTVTTGSETGDER